MKKWMLTLVALLICVGLLWWGLASKNERLCACFQFDEGQNGTFLALSWSREKIEEVDIF